jgi:DNA polymerase-3 subunit alpha/error-prone DNA polymerase
MQLLTRLANEGLLRIYGNTNVLARARVEKELKVIDELKFSGYFLINWDIIQYSMGFMHIGRGSGANSIISYCLGITNICPLELDLYFERFLNLNRKSPPDFDIDWRKSGIPFSNTFLIDTVEIVWLLWHQCGIQIPLDIPRSG